MPLHLPLPGYDGVTVELDIVTESRRIAMRKEQAQLLSQIRALLQELQALDAEQQGRAADINDEVLTLSSAASLMAAKRFVKGIEGLTIPGVEPTPENVYEHCDEKVWIALRNLVSKHLGFSDDEEKKSLPPSISPDPEPEEAGSTNAPLAS